MAMTLHFSVLTPGLAPPPLKSQLACKPELDVQVQPATAEMPTLSISSAPSFSLYSKPFLSLQSPPHQTKLFSLRFHPLRFQSNHGVVMKKNRRGFGAVCYSVPLAPQSLQFVCTISSAVLMLSKGTAVQKSFLVPFFALQAPTSIVSWIKGEYGTWTAFLALLVRLFFFIPGELELPFVALLLVIVAPYQVMNLRGTQVGAILSLLIAGYLAFQHFSRAGSLRKAFDQGSVVATLAIICITAVSCLLFI